MLPRAREHGPPQPALTPLHPRLLIVPCGPRQYELRVGRAVSPTGPYLDRAGRDMARGGGSLLLRNVTKAGGHTLVGPGHAGVLHDAPTGKWAITFDFQGVDDDDDTQYQTQARELLWDADEWPVVSDANFFGGNSLMEASVRVEA